MGTEGIRLNRFLALSGVCSRRSAERLIREGRVSVNGHTCTDLAVRVDPGTDTVAVDGNPVAPPGRLVYIALNKPRGYVTTMSDEHGRRCVKDLVEGLEERVFPVGRLDKESEGLLLFTNDGVSAHRMMHPGFGLRKVYEVTLGRSVSDSDLQKLTDGVELEDGPARALDARFVGKDRRRVELTIQEGRKREIRRMFEALEVPVTSLKRTRFGPVALGELPAGSWRRLTQEEVRLILGAVGNGRA